MIAEQLIASAESEGQSGTGHGQPAQQLRSHYLCEQAEYAVESGDKGAARALYKQALRDQPQDLRALIGLCRCALKDSNAALAMDYFHRVIDSERRCTPEMLELLRDICAAQHDSGLYLASLQRYYDQQHSPLLALALGEELSGREGTEAANIFLRSTLEQYPSASVAASLALSALKKEDVQPERQVLDQLIRDDHGYRVIIAGLQGKRATGDAPVVVTGTRFITEVEHWSK